MYLEIKRFKEIYDGTIGAFSLFDEDNKLLLSGFTLEPSGPDTVMPNQDRRIPEGAYKAIWEYSPKFNRFLPVLFNEKVSKDRRILIHYGNYPKDTEGCILFGDSYNNSGVFNSRDMFANFEKEIKRDEFKINIINAF
ncbi:hypothetical protein CBLAS_0920 [Campylobacter blaseri]|uniref:DUF5675 family protein n=1 Tax=Campylobacter blaseri TaxID=2042961 RepID=UPI00155DBAB2|nr:DUF5675 family protein [Campylobacter blaseri]QKF86105.1 hypothetical protein CBLAS_0920 [Campylobacter blaseri]